MEDFLHNLKSYLLIETETHLVPSPSTADPQSHGCSTAHVRVIALRQQRHHTGTLLRSPEERQEDISVNDDS